MFLLCNIMFQQRYLYMEFHTQLYCPLSGNVLQKNWHAHTYVSIVGNFKQKNIRLFCSFIFLFPNFKHHHQVPSSAWHWEEVKSQFQYFLMLCWICIYYIFIHIHNRIKTHSDIEGERKPEDLFAGGDFKYH